MYSPITYCILVPKNDQKYMQTHPFQYKKSDKLQSKQEITWYSLHTVIIRYYYTADVALKGHICLSSLLELLNFFLLQLSCNLQLKKTIFLGNYKYENYTAKLALDILSV